jgi:hypothetical protein
MTNIGKSYWAVMVGIVEQSFETSIREKSTQKCVSLASRASIVLEQWSLSTEL